VTLDDFDSYLSAAADALSSFDYEIRSTQHQVTKQRIWAVVNSISDAPTQLAGSRGPEEVAYLRRLLDAMFETYNTRRREVQGITGLQALEKKVLKGSGGAARTEGAPIDRGLTQEQAERTLEGLVAEGWFERSKEGWYTLSPRALTELRGWLVETYNDSDDPEEWQRIKFCEACKEIVTVGQRCGEMECNVRLHDICEAAFWTSRPSKRCPSCETPWDGKAFVGQRAITTTEDYLKGKRRSSGVGRRQAVEEEEEEEEVEVVEENGVEEEMEEDD
jgi:non-structural maintenance of chromosomes element 1